MRFFPLQASLVEHRCDGLEIRAWMFDQGGARARYPWRCWDARFLYMLTLGGAHRIGNAAARM